ncbi:MAG: Hsp70 family protein, partial [bacterium]|nr:Hsp70 family protein [bacterium]
IEKTRRSCLQAMADAGLKPEHIDEVVLVGGSTRIPAVRRLVETIFRKPPHCDINPDEVVALGAAVQADILAGGTTDMLLLDVTPLSLGIETFGGVMSRIIERNTTIPTSASEMFTTFVDGQTNVDIHVLQGERELAGDCRSLARFTLKGIPPQPAGMPRVEVTFTIDADGILHVKAHDKRTGKEQQVDVHPTYGLTDEEVEAMLEASIEHAEQDFEQRQLIEARNEAEMTLAAARKSLERHGEVLNAEEQMQVEAALEDLDRMRRSTNHQAIRAALETFEVVLRPLSERQLSRAIKEALQNPTPDVMQDGGGLRGFAHAPIMHGRHDAMRALRYLLQVAIHAALFLVALDVILSGVWGLADHPMLVLLGRVGAPTGPMACYVYWVVALLLPPACWLVQWAIWTRRPAALQVRTSAGDALLIHRGALIKFVRAQVESHPAIVSQRVRVRQIGARGISIKINVSVVPTSSLPEIKRQIESSIRDGFAQVLGIEKIDRIDIVLDLSETDLKTHPGPAGHPAPPSEPPVRGSLTPAPSPRDETGRTQELLFNETAGGSGDETAAGRAAGRAAETPKDTGKTAPARGDETNQ